MSDDPKVMVEYYRDLERKKILAIPEGDELNVLVRKHVFGSEVFKIPAGWAYKTDDSWHFIPNYSSSISAAWEVVEKADIGEISKSYRAGGVWYWGACLKGEWAYAKSAPEAICKVALLAEMDL